MKQYRQSVESKVYLMMQGIRSPNEALLWYCMKSIKYTEKIRVFFPTLNSFSFQFTKYAQLFMDFFVLFFYSFELY